MSGKVQFCPFCRECFEDIERCPEHDLPLVSFEAIAATPRERADDEPVPMLDPGRGRAELVVAAIGLLAGFAMPFVTVRAFGRSQAFTGLAAAAERAPNLWAVPVAGALLGSFVLRRRTPIQMRGARLAAIVIALAPIVSVIYSVRRILFAASLESGITVDVEVGPWVVGASGVLAIVGAVRFGGRLRASLRPPSSPDTGEPAH